MSWPSLKTYDRIRPAPGDDGGASSFEKSYLGMRLAIGVIGVALPISLVIVERWILDPSVSVRGSMSAYYHSAARDLFVGGLAACGVTLMTYMFWKWWTWDFLISLFAGAATIGVAAFPTARPRDPSEPATALSCDTTDGLPPCTALQQAWGEGDVRSIHLVMTGAVVASFAALCLVFALRDFGYGKGAHEITDNDVSRMGPRRIWKQVKTAGGGSAAILAHIWTRAPRTVLYLLCMAGVIAGAAWALVGPDWIVPHSYAGEFIAFTAFGIAWIVASWDLLKGLGWLETAVNGVAETLGVQTQPSSEVATADRSDHAVGA